MLGDNDIYGRFYANLDDKNRLCLPAKTGVEAGEELLIVSTGYSKYIVSKHYFDEYVRNIKEELQNPVSKVHFKELLELYEDLCSMIIKSTRADKQHRILVTDVYSPEQGKAEMMGVGKVLKLL